MDIVTKICKKCKTERPITDFYRSKYTKNRLQSTCKICQKENAISWKENNKERIREYGKRYYRENRDAHQKSMKRQKASKKDKNYNTYLKYHYGITKEEYDFIFKSQNGLCKTCGKPQNDKRLAVDHNHSTGFIRGLLCQKCNMVLGLVNDNTRVLKNMIEYLEK